MPPRLLDKTQTDWAYEKHCEGYTFQEIADALFVNVSTIRDEFKRNNLKKKLPPLTYDPDEKVPYIVYFSKNTNAKINMHQLNWAYHYHWKNYTLTEISSALGVPRATLSETLKRHHLKIRYRSIQRKALVYPYFTKEE